MSTANPVASQTVTAADSSQAAAASKTSPSAGASSSSTASISSRSRFLLSRSVAQHAFSVRVLSWDCYLIIEELSLAACNSQIACRSDDLDKKFCSLNKTVYKPKRKPFRFLE